MDNYYQVLLTKVNDAFTEENYDECRRLIDEELSMPYVPLAVEEKFNEIKLKLPNTSETVKKSVSDTEVIAKLLKGNTSQQVQAIEYLDDLNVRSYLPLIKEYLANNENHEMIKSYLITICIKQQIDEEMIVEKSNCIYTIIPASLMLPEQTEGYQETCERLDGMLGSDDPSLLNLALDVLYQLIYLKLPESYEVDEVDNLVYSIIRYVMLAMNDTQRWQKICADDHIEESKLMNINL